MTEEIQFLKDLQAQLRYEEAYDYDSQAAPRFWVIMDYRTTPAAEGYDDSYVERFYNDGDFTAFTDFAALFDFIEEYLTDNEIEPSEELLDLLTGEEEFDDLWDYVLEELNGNGYYDSVHVKEERFIAPNTMFLTKKEAKKHLELNHYHYTSKAHTYAMTAWRAPQVERLMKILNNVDFELL